jgi:hypothetical protein
MTTPTQRPASNSTARKRDTDPHMWSDATADAVRAAKAEAWDEGKWATYSAEREGRDGSELINPYRADRLATDTAAPAVLRVHNHPPYEPTCNERRVDGHLRGACLNDDGSDL